MARTSAQPSAAAGTRARCLGPAVVVCLAGAALATALGGRCWAAPGQQGPRVGSGRRIALMGGALASTGGLLAAPSHALTAEEWNTIQLFRQSSPSVLLVSDGLQDPQDGRQNKRINGILGSGFAWDDSHVVTSASMMRHIAQPQVTIVEQDPGSSEERRSVHKGSFVGSDPMTDVAVLRVDTAMKPLKRGVTSALRVGQDVYALGHPFGFEHSLSKGVVAGLSRTLVTAAGWPVGGVIQTDASINPGNSGGPLLDSEGRVIGVNNAILSSSGQFAGVGLAVPIEAVEKSVNSVIATGHVEAPSMGVVLAQDGIPQTVGFDGVMVRKVEQDSPAFLAGVRPMRGGHLGDIILAVNDQRVDSAQAFYGALVGKSPGDEILLIVTRPGEDATTDEWSMLAIRLALGSRIL